MGIFTRVRDIISSNLNTMLEKAEDPEKLVKLMIREMEDTLVEIKASCAGAMATKKKIERDSDGINERAEAWGVKAQMALDKDREFLVIGGVFSHDMIDSYISLKRDDIKKFNMTTHPIEFEMYYSL